MAITNNLSAAGFPRGEVNAANVSKLCALVGRSAKGLSRVETTLRKASSFPRSHPLTSIATEASCADRGSTCRGHCGTAKISHVKRNRHLDVSQIRVHPMIEKRRENHQHPGPWPHVVLVIKATGATNPSRIWTRVKELENGYNSKGGLHWASGLTWKSCQPYQLNHDTIERNRLQLNRESLYCRTARKSA
jgi:hypothetical protein